MVAEDDGNFSYEGYLVFNRIYSTKLLKPDFDFYHVIEEELTDFSQGSPKEPGQGYQTLPFEDYLRESTEVSPSLKEAVGDIKAFRYLEEEWEIKEVENEDQLEQRPVRDRLMTVDSYWAYPDYIFIKGNKTKAKQASELIRMTLDDYLELNQIGLNSDFLLWLLSQEKNNDVIPGDVSTNMLTDAAVEGEEKDRFGRRNKIDDSTDITKSTPVLMGVLQHKDLTALEGVFEVDKKFVQARISTEGRIHVKADHAVAGSPDIERMSMALVFLQELTGLYEHWIELPNEEKYPPIEFFEDIYQECDRQGVEITFSIDDVIEEYRQKGSPEDYKQRQSGLGEFE